MEQTIAQLEQNVAELLAKAEEMKQLIEKAKKEETWPNMNEAYWYASGNGIVYQDYWENTYDDNNQLKFNNVHRSKAEGEAYVQKRLVQAELERLAAKAWKDSGADNTWDNVKHKYHIYYSHSGNNLTVDANTTIQYIGQMFFPTETSAYDAIKTIGGERLKVLLK